MIVFSIGYNLITLPLPAYWMIFGYASDIKTTRFQPTVKIFFTVTHIFQLDQTHFETKSRIRHYPSGRKTLRDKWFFFHHSRPQPPKHSISLVFDAIGVERKTHS